MAFDLTDYSDIPFNFDENRTPVQQPVPQQPQQVVRPEGNSINPSEAEKIRKLNEDFARVPGLTRTQKRIEQNHKEELPGAWRIDKFTEDGQTQAGEVDDEQSKFLQETTMVD